MYMYRYNKKLKTFALDYDLKHREIAAILGITISILKSYTRLQVSFKKEHWDILTAYAKGLQKNPKSLEYNRELKNIIKKYGLTVLDVTVLAQISERRARSFLRKGKYAVKMNKLELLEIKKAVHQLQLKPSINKAKIAAYKAHTRGD